MKNIITFRPAILLCSSLLLVLLAKNAMAAVDYWDPQGTTGKNPTTVSPAGTWENNDWSTSSAGVATPTAWVNNDAACFAVHSGSSTPAFTVTMNAAHTVAGFFNGPLSPDPCNATVSGSGIMTMLAANLNGFDVTQDPTTDFGYVTINNVITGGSTAGICMEATGQVYLNGVNTFTGGTFLGYTGSHWDGILNFNNSASLGTGGIYLSGISPGFTGALVAEGSSAITLPNSVTVCETGTSSLNIVGVAPVGSPPSGVTFSGPWSLSGSQGNTAGSDGLVPVITTWGPVYISSGGVAGNLVTISGVISGTNGLSKFGAGMLELTAANTYGTAGAPISQSSNAWTTVSNGWLLLDNTTGSATGVSSVLVAGGILGGYGYASGPVTVNSGSVITATNLTVGGPATLTTGPLALSTGSIDLCHISSASSADELVVNGAATLGNITLTLVTLTAANTTGALATPITSGIWPIMTASGGITAGTITINSTGVSGATGNFTTVVSGDTLYLVLNPAGTTPPVAGAIALQAVEGVPIVTSVAKILSVDSTANAGGSLSISSVYSPTGNGATATLSAPGNSGTITYTSAANLNSDTISYVLTDGFASTVGTIAVSVVANGTSDNFISGQSGGPGSVTIQAYGIPGTTYYIQQSTTSPGLPPWTDVGSATASPLGMINFTVPGPVPSPSYYRTSTTP